jgi:hypothetical protein
MLDGWSVQLLGRSIHLSPGALDRSICAHREGWRGFNAIQGVRR